MKLKLPTKDDGRRWPLIIGLGIVSLILLTLYGLHLGSLVPASVAERATLSELQSISAIAHDPLLAPYKLLAWVLLHLPGNDLINIRLASVIITLICAGLFYSLARRWHGRSVGATMTLLFASSGWMLSTGRHGAGIINLTLCVLALLSTAVLINKAKDSKHADKAVLAFAGAIALALMTPGGIWFALATLAVVGKQLLDHAKLASITGRSIAGSVAAVGLAVFGLTCAGGTAQLHQALAIPSTLPGSIVIAKQAVLSVSGFVVRGPEMPSIWLSHTPLLDVASSTLLLLGAILYARHLGNSRTRLLLAFVIVGAALTALNGAIALSYLLPVVYLVIASGLAYFIMQWRKVFPRNPAATVTAIGILGVVVLSIISFHVQRYFIAWRYNPSTVQSYRQAADNGRQDAPYLIQ